jgi:hypothetical protein
MVWRVVCSRAVAIPLSANPPSVAMERKIEYARLDRASVATEEVGIQSCPSLKEPLSRH